MQPWPKEKKTVLTKQPTPSSINCCDRVYANMWGKYTCKQCTLGTGFSGLNLVPLIRYTCLWDAWYWAMMLTLAGHSHLCSWGWKTKNNRHHQDWLHIKKKKIIQIKKIIIKKNTPPDLHIRSFRSPSQNMIWQLQQRPQIWMEFIAHTCYLGMYLVAIEAWTPAALP